MTWVYGRNQHQGRSHARRQITCQDVTVLHEDKDILYAFVADGAGTALYAREAALLAVETMKDFLQKGRIFQERELFLKEGFSTVNQTLHMVATRKNIPQKDFLTTLIVGCFSREEAIFGQVGDGFVVIQETCEGPLSLPLKKKKEYANETDLLPASDLAVRIYISRHPIHFFALSSDGLERVAIDQKTEEPHVPFFTPFVDYLHTKPSSQEVEKELEAFLGSEKLQHRVDDDVSLVIGAWL
jgi:hypothetical protein